MRIFRSVLGLVVVATFTFSVLGQDSFQNLNFESANVQQSQTFGFVNSTAALPGWTIFYETNDPQVQVGYNVGAVFGVVGPLVSLMGTNTGGISSISGNFSVFLQGGEVVTVPGGGPYVPETYLNQTGLVPADTQSITFEAQPGTAMLLLSLNGQDVPFTALATESDYTLYGGNIPAFAGQVSDLEFTVGLYGTGWNLDSINFSAQSVPEPSTLTLIVAGIGLLWLPQCSSRIGLRRLAKFVSRA